jgi:O-antigen/teichoic acid export membrane protein
MNNIVCSFYVNRHYGYLQEQVSGSLSKEDTKGLVKDVKGLLLTKISETTFNGTDNIFISVFIGIEYVGILSNYTLLLTTVNTLMNKVFGSITAILGNLAASDDRKQTETVLKRLFFLNTAIYGYLCVGMMLLTKEFVVDIWLTEDYVLPGFLIVLAITELFFRSIHYPLYITRNAMGYFSQYNWLFLVAAFVNLILDFLLVKPFGMSGLYIATILGRGITYLADIYVVYHFGFQKSPAEYLLLILKWVAFLGVSVVIAYHAIGLIPWSGIWGFALRILMITIVYGVLFLLVYSRSQEWKYYFQLGKRLVNKKEK